MEQLERKLYEHEKRADKLELSISQLAHSLESLATSVGASNRKLEDLATLIATQNTIMERVANIDKEVRESFKHRDETRKEENKRLHTRIDDATKLIDVRVNAMENLLKDYPIVKDHAINANNTLVRVGWTVITLVIVALVGTIITQGAKV